MIDGILALVIVCFAAVVAYQTTLFTLMSMSAYSMTVPWLKMGYIFMALPIFMLAVVYYYLKSFFENIVHIFTRYVK